MNVPSRMTGKKVKRVILMKLAIAYACDSTHVRTLVATQVGASG